jgi:predicted RNase H-like HicB family nuclease
MLLRYIQAAMHRAHYEFLPDDQLYYSEIPNLPGVYATGASLETCRDELAEVLEAWILFRVSQHLTLPILDGIDLSIREVA